MSDLIGRTLGQYKILSEIGHGGMANVYRAEQPSIRREVAIKVLPPHFLQDRTFLKRFSREVQIIAKLQHPHILPVYDFSDEDDLPYIVMAYMKGGTLADLIHREKSLPLEEVVRLTEQIASGLDHAHQQGIIHRDFKPSNVLLDEHNNIYLADFGIAKMAESVSQITGSGIIGTPAYMAPEVTQTTKVTSLVDIYALGVTLFEMLTGQHPYPSETPVGVLMAHAVEPIPNVCQHRPDLPAEIQRVIDRAMAKDPADRYQTAGALAADLRAVLVGDSPLTDATPRPGGSGGISTISLFPTRPSSAEQTNRGFIVLAAFFVVVAVLAGLTALGVPSMVARIITGQSPADGVIGTPTTDVSPTPAASPTPLYERILTGHSDAVTSVVISPDGKMLASGSLDKTVILWDMQTDKALRTLEMPDQTYRMVFFPDNELLMVGGQNGVASFWSTQTGEQINKQEFLPAGQLSVAISPDQTTYTIASRDLSIPLFDAKTYGWLKVLTYANPIWSVAYSPNNVVVAAGGGDGSITLSDSETDEELHVLEGHTDGVNYLAFSSDGEMLASASKDMTIILWNPETGKKLYTLSQHTGPVNSVAWSPDGKTLASASQDGTIKLWDSATGKLLDTLESGGNVIHSVVFNVDGTLLASGMEDGTIILWKID